jgi:hypothetical protein
LLGAALGDALGGPSMRAWLSLFLFLTGCGMETTPTSTGSPRPTDPAWPKRVTLVTKLATNESGGVRLADGALVEGGRDLSLDLGRVLSLSSPTSASLCEKGKFDALEDIPTTVDTCPASLSGTWEQRTYLSAASLHTNEESSVVGLGLLMRNEEHTALYRLRIVGDSYDASGVSTATFDYEPVP